MFEKTETRTIIICEFFFVSVTTFYRAAWNADAVLRWEFCLSIRLSVCQTRALWQNGRKIGSDFLHHTKDHL